VIVGNLRRLQSTLTRDGNLSAWNQAQRLYARSRAVVPYLTSQLYNSAYINNIGDKKFPMWAVGYDTVEAPHAVIVHDTPNRVHPTRGPSSEPKQDHFLSEPRDAMEASYPREVAADLGRSVRSIRFPTAPSRRRR
jgi:hypothetical protein